jgi:NAD(P)-dependent dehydrogenase (short-subunit alcohol dehydrogenase family)
VNAVAAGQVLAAPEPTEREPAVGTEHSSRGRRSVWPEEVAPAYVFFASSADSGFITGQVLAELRAVPR